jgi:hypothetical protein
VVFFHVDESGNTGNNLFDAQQPRLSYGVLSSKTNADALCLDLHRQILAKIGDTRIHASTLGVGGLSKIAPELMRLQKKMRFDFDYYFVDKPAYALISFFEAVFDAGLNEAVKWDAYWTPLRYVLIYKLSGLLDEDLLRRSWELCTATRIDTRAGDISRLLADVKVRVERSSLDLRSEEIIIDALRYGIAKPLSLDFGCTDQKFVSPNAVGFQFVVAAIARRIRKQGRRKANAIIVDKQTQFNAAQIQTHTILRRFSEGFKTAPEAEKRAYIAHPLSATLDKADIVHKDLPDTPVTVSSSADSIGLQIVDVYLWIANRIRDSAELSPELIWLWQSFGPRSLIDGISLEGLASRYEAFERMLPDFDDLSEEQLTEGKRLIDEHRAKVRSLL